MQPGSVDLRSLRATEDLVIGILPPAVELVTLAPLTPLATHAALGGVAQNNVVTTVRLSEVAADPTAGLALVAAARRHHLRGREGAVVRLAAPQRVTRAQLPKPEEGAMTFAHFSIFGFVAARSG